MRWRDGRRSGNVEDRRGRRVRGGFGIGGGALLFIILLALLLGENPLVLLDSVGGLPGPAGPEPSSAELSAPSKGLDEGADFISVVLASTEDTWTAVLGEHGRAYREPTLVLFSDMVQSACGFNSAAVGPFYCPPDQQVYIDLSFFDQLSRMGAEGDFARAYVLAHEVGHHVQNLLGISEQVRAAQSRADEVDSNALSVFLELQADCYAGVWAHHAERQRHILESGDIQEGLAAAAAVGDDRLMRRAGRAVRPESFTHGTSEQRADWLRRGLSEGTLEACDTFNAARR